MFVLSKYPYSFESIKCYELANHLGNVMVTVSDKREGVDMIDAQGNPVLDANGDYAYEDGIADGYFADVVSAQDYYPYGKTLREYNPDKEKYLTTQHQRDTETGFDYRGARFYDSDVARFLSVDPLATKYPNTSSYVYVGDNPIVFIDPDGREIKAAKSLKGMKLRVFNSLLKSNEQYKKLLKRYDNNRLDYVVGTNEQKGTPDYAQTKPEEFETARSPSRKIYALYKGEVSTNFVKENTTNLTEIGIAATLIHEAVHANILAEYKFEDVSSSDHHKPFSEKLFNATYNGISEYNKDNNLNYSDKELKLLSSNWLWGTDAVDKAFGLDKKSKSYDDDLDKLKKDAKELYNK